MSGIHLTNAQWGFIRPLQPAQACTGRPWGDDGWTTECILYVLITGCRWQDLPREYGAPTTVWRRLRRRGRGGRVGTQLAHGARRHCILAHRLLSWVVRRMSGSLWHPGAG